MNKPITSIKLPKGYRWKIEGSPVFSGVIVIKLQEKGKIFWRTLSKTSYGIYKDQIITEKEILRLETELWNEQKELIANQTWIKEHL